MMISLGSGAARRLTLPILASIPGLVHGFTVKGSELAAVMRAAAGSELPLMTLRQVHGASVHRVETATDGFRSEPHAKPAGDALVTSLGRQALAVFVADCVPALVCDPPNHIVAAVHAGWRGTAAGVLRATLETMRRLYGSRPDDLRVALGPAIGPCCFEVGDEVVERLLASDPGAGGCVVRASGRRPRVDLIEANRHQAMEFGVTAGRIRSIGLCTRCEPVLLESYRRNGPDAGRMAGIIAWAS